MWDCRKRVASIQVALGILWLAWDSVLFFPKDGSGVEALFEGTEDGLSSHLREGLVCRSGPVELVASS